MHSRLNNEAIRIATGLRLGPIYVLLTNALLERRSMRMAHTARHAALGRVGLQTLCLIIMISFGVQTKAGFPGCKGVYTGLARSDGRRPDGVTLTPWEDGKCLGRAVTKTPKHHHITPVLKSLHWLKIPKRVEYKVISLTCNTLQTSQPSYLRQLFTIQPLCPTRSSSSLTLLRPSVTSSLKFANRSIAIAVPSLWNKLPPALRQISDPSTKSPNSTSCLSILFTRLSAYE